MYRKIIISFTAGTLIFALAACGQTVQEKVIESQTGGKVKVNKRKGTVEFKTKEGTFKTSDSKLPEDFPKDVPIYKGAKVKGSISAQGAQSARGADMTVVLEAKVGFDTVASYYMKAMPAEGWKEVSKFEGGEGASRAGIYGYEKGGRRATISISRDEKDTEAKVSIILTDK